MIYRVLCLIMRCVVPCDVKCTCYTVMFSCSPKWVAPRHDMRSVRQSCETGSVFCATYLFMCGCRIPIDRWFGGATVIAATDCREIPIYGKRFECGQHTAKLAKRLATWFFLGCFSTTWLFHLLFSFSLPLLLVLSFLRCRHFGVTPNCSASSQLPHVSRWPKICAST